jgi:carbamoyl-phosphate synthase large subunit
MACFEPTIDYCVVKIPRFTFEKFPGANETLTISMKSVGEAMSIGRTFKEAFQKGLRSMETKLYGLEDLRIEPDRETIIKKLSTPNADRVQFIKAAFKSGFTLDEVFELTKIDRWFLHNMIELIEMEANLKKFNGKEVSRDILLEAKKNGFSDIHLGKILGLKEIDVWNLRKSMGVVPVYKLVDTCGAEFEAFTPYYYSTYETEDESRV